MGTSRLEGALPLAARERLSRVGLTKATERLTVWIGSQIKSLSIEPGFALFIRKSRVGRQHCTIFLDALVGGGATCL